MTDKEQDLENLRYSMEYDLTAALFLALNHALSQRLDIRESGVEPFIWLPELESNFKGALKDWPRPEIDWSRSVAIFFELAEDELYGLGYRDLRNAYITLWSEEMSELLHGLWNGSKLGFLEKILTGKVPKSILYMRELWEAWKDLAGDDTTLSDAEFKSDKFWLMYRRQKEDQGN